jgi:hypothetical protein
MKLLIDMYKLCFFGLFIYLFVLSLSFLFSFPFYVLVLLLVSMVYLVITLQICVPPFLMHVNA